MVKRSAKAKEVAGSMDLRILCVHGAGRHPTGGPWEGEWLASIRDSLKELDGKVNPIIEFAYLDTVFDKHPMDLRDVLEAIAKLAKVGTASLFRQPKGIGDQIRWTAGMVLKWVENESLRAEARQVVEKKIKEFKPDIVCAHSLGSLICYDLFSGSGENLIKGRTFVSCGSQIGNPFVVGNFAAGRLTGLRQAKFWFHLYNIEDSVFTAEIRLSEPNFAQIETLFDIQGPADHDVTEYMHHRRTLATVWSDALMALHKQPLERALPEVPKSSPARSLVDKPKRRALLVGINEYPDPAQNLEGCVNDVYLMSSLLQESGFESEDIRLVLNDRATHAGVRERLEWLLDDAKAGDLRFFYYSGHGAQIPTYSVGDRVDRLDETLVLYDFDWTNAHAFTDDDFYALYSQLPYDLRFVAVFDCCHSGGLTRASVSKIRGIDPPDDIRHRMLRWDAKREMWVERKIESPNPLFEKKLNPPKTKDATMNQRSTHRLGQAMDLRTAPPPELKRKAAARGHLGPYLPVLIYASREEEFSYEYAHGSIAYGAFTYSLVKTLRTDRRSTAPRLTFSSLMDDVGRELADLGYQQRPTLVAPKDIKKLKIPLSI